MEEDLRRLQRMFRHEKVLDMSTLGGRFPSRSRRSLFRDLAELGYLTSYSHAGRFYTLADIADFDQRGLWFFRDIGFSRAGTLKQTVAIQVEEAPDGRTHAELRHVLGVRVHNTLLGLVREERVAREPFEGLHLYVSADAERAAQQMARRTEGVAGALRAPTAEETLEILVEALRAAPHVPQAAVVAKRLAARGVRVEGRHVQQVFEAHGLQPEKKRRGPARRPLGAEEPAALAAGAVPAADAELGGRTGEHRRGASALPPVRRLRDGQEDGTSIRPHSGARRFQHPGDRLRLRRRLSLAFRPSGLAASRLPLAAPSPQVHHGLRHHGFRGAATLRAPPPTRRDPHRVAR